NLPQPKICRARREAVNQGERLRCRRILGAPRVYAAAALRLSSILASRREDLMNVLLACPGIFDEIGGGQRFYANLILNNPAIEFYCGVDRTPSAIVPRNAHCLRLTDVHRRQTDSFRPDLIPAGSPIAPLGDN